MPIYEYNCLDCGNDFETLVFQVLRKNMLSKLPEGKFRT